MCHPSAPDRHRHHVPPVRRAVHGGDQAAVTCTGVTGVEMEALTAVSVAALTIYDMCKAVQKDMEITNIRLLEKSGGKSGDYKRED